jgi:hypothetical protein
VEKVLKKSKDKWYLHIYAASFEANNGVRHHPEYWMVPDTVITIILVFPPFLTELLVNYGYRED